MKKLYTFLIVCALTAVAATAQNFTGRVYDAQTSEPLLGVSVIYEIQGELRGIATDNTGYYELNLPTGSNDITFSYVGYEDERILFIMNPYDKIVRDIYLKSSTNLMQEVVVSAGRFEQKLSDLTVSMDLMKAADIARQSPTDLSGSLNTLPGVDINDKQPSIRGGSGWTYGVGSRSQVLVDGMSILSPGNGEINWNSIPMENVEQVEVLKGAASVLYGSSALNGLINVRTARPGLRPKTTIKAYVGIYGNPSNEDYIWWDKGLWQDGDYPVKPLLRNSVFYGIRNPIYEGFEVSHTRRIDNFDISGGVNLLTDEGYRQQSYNKRFHVNGNLTYHHPSDNIINYGTNIDLLTNKYGDFFIWRSPMEAYQPSAFTNMGREGNSFRIDPFFNFTNPDKNTSHRIKARFFYRADNINSDTKTNSLLKILGNMGADVDGFMDLIGNVVDGNYSDLAALIPPLLSGDLDGVVDGALNLGDKLFPNATTSDLGDLISWFMTNGLPSGSSDLVSWASGLLYPEKSEKLIDRFYNYYLDYNYSKKIGEARITAGVTYEHGVSQAKLTNRHESDNAAFYFQYDQMFFDRLNVSLGLRGEYYRVDEHYREAETKLFGTNIPFKPILRGGINYKLAEYSYIRASFGQGYRYPSIVEKFARIDVGGAGVYPNHQLKAESGYNAEIGIRQGYKVGSFQGFFDLAGFFTEYKDMIEFRFGIFNNDTFEYINSVPQLFNLVLNGNGLGIGAMFYNVSKARIGGIDFSTNGVWTINRNMKMLYNMGYVFIEPRDVDYKKMIEQESEYTDPLQMKEKSNDSKYLKYRQKHTVKGSFDFEWKRFSLGTNLAWKSKTLAVDYFMVDERTKPYGKYDVMDYVRDIIFGNIDGESLNSYWRKTNKGYFTMDLRAGIIVTKKVEFQIQVSNLLNKEYSTRPMAVAAPRTTICQMKLTF